MFFKELKVIELSKMNSLFKSPIRQFIYDMIVFIKNVVLRNFEKYLKNRDYLFLEHRKIYVFIFTCNNIEGQMFD